jgi:hypothetical protein
MAIAMTWHALEASRRASQAWSDMYLGNWSEFNVYTESAVHNKSLICCLVAKSWCSAVSRLEGKGMAQPQA